MTGTDRGSLLMVWGGGTGVGGTETRMAEVVQHLSRQGRPCTSIMLSAQADSRLAGLLATSGSRVVATRSPRTLARAVRDLEPRVVMVFGLRASLVTRMVRTASHRGKRGWPPVVDARNGLEANRSTSAWALDRWTQRAVDTFLANSDAAADNLEAHGIRPSRLATLYSALAEAWYRPSPDVARDPTSVMMIGNARPEKQQALGLRVFSELDTDAHLTVFTNDASALRQQWSACTPVSNIGVRFIEGHTVTREDLDRAAIVLHPSSHESAPRALMEARARGCHVVAFDVGDTRRIVGDGGRVVSAGDNDALARALAEAVRLSVAGVLEHTPFHYQSVAEYAEALMALGEAPPEGSP